MSLLVFPVGLAVHIDSAFSSHHVTVLAKLLHRGSDLESPDGRDLRRRQKKQRGQGPKESRTHAREGTGSKGGQAEHGGGKSKIGQGEDFVKCAGSHYRGYNEGKKNKNDLNFRHFDRQFWSS